MPTGYDNLPDDPFEDFTRRLKAQGERIKELERPTGTQLAQTVQQLQAAVEDIQVALANQVSPAASTGSNSNFAVTTSETSFASVGITVPTGYTRALVYAGGGLSASQDLTGGRLFCHVRIAGVDGPDTIGLVTTSWPYSSVAAFSTRSLTSLTGGSTITTELRAYFSSGSTDPALQLWNTASLAVSIVFLK